MIARALRLRQRLTVRIRASETAKIAPFAKSLAGKVTAQAVAAVR
jgi:hypothetical protein